MGLTEGHLLWEPIGGWSDKPNLSVYPQPLCCRSLFPQDGRITDGYQRGKVKAR